MDYNIAEFALREVLKNKAEYAEVRLEETKTNGFMMKNGIPQISGFDRTHGMGIKFLLNKTSGFLSTNSLEKNKIKQLIVSAIKTAKRASEISEKIMYSPERISRKSYNVKQRIKLQDFSSEKKLDLLKNIDNSIMDSKVNVIGRYLSVLDFETEKLYLNSEGSRIFSHIPITNFTYLLTIKSKEIVQHYWQYGYSGGFETILNKNFPSLLKKEVKILDNVSKKGAKAPRGNVDLVLGPQITGIMVHESVGHPYEADRILGRESAQAGESFVKKNMLHSRIGSDCVNVIDDPTLKNGYGFYLYDDEGVKARPRKLIQNGIINEFLHNRETASSMGIKSNGSARAMSYENEAIVRMANTYMAPGDYKENELFVGIKLGVYIRSFMEWNIDDIRFNQKYVGAEAYLIKNGKIGIPVIRPVLEITTPKLYSSIDAVANNLEFHAGNCGKGEPLQSAPVWLGGPSVRLRNVRLGK